MTFFTSHLRSAKLFILSLSVILTFVFFHYFSTVAFAQVYSDFETSTGGPKGPDLCPYDDKRGPKDWPCFDGRPPTLAPGCTTWSPGNYKFTKAQVYTCMTGPGQSHAYIGVVIIYTDDQGNTQQRRVVTGKNMVGDHTDFQDRDLNNCRFDGNVGDPDKIEDFAKNQ